MFTTVIKKIKIKEKKLHSTCNGKKLLLSLIIMNSIHDNLLCMLFVIYLHFLKVIRFLFTALAILKNKKAALCL